MVSFRSFQHSISCYLSHCPIDKGLHIKLMSLRRFHGTRLLQRGQGIDDNLLRDDGTILGEADSAEPGGCLPQGTQTSPL